MAPRTSGSKLDVGNELERRGRGREGKEEEGGKEEEKEGKGGRRRLNCGHGH